jgi:hypothetical protein
MDLKRLVGVLLQRLAPVYVATALWCVTGYFVFMIGGAALTIALEITWPLLRPLFEVLYEELMTQRAQAQAQRRTALLKAFLPFFQAYKTVLTAYPPAMLTRSAPEVTAQLETFAEVVRDVKARRAPEPEDPFQPQDEAPYEIVQTALLTPRDFRDWSLQDCQTWRRELLAVLAKGRIAALRHAVQHMAHERPQHVWEACLTEAAHDLAREAEQTLCRWHCVQQAHTDPAVCEHLATLLRLDAIHRQTALQRYLTTHLQCPPAEIATVMGYIRYDSVATAVLALIEGKGRSAELVARPRETLSPPQAAPDV